MNTIVGGTTHLTRTIAISNQNENENKQLSCCKYISAMPPRLADSITSPKDPAFTMDAGGQLRITDGASSMVQHIDNILYSTNGFVGVKHHIISPCTIRSSAIVNGSYHRSLLQGNVPINSNAMPLFEHIGSILCYSDISLFVGGELCVCRDSMDASMNITTGVYSFQTVAHSPQFEVDVVFSRLASLLYPEQWSTQFSVGAVRRRGATTSRACCGGQGADAPFASSSHSESVQVRIVSEVRADAHLWFANGDAIDYRTVGSGASIEYVSSDIMMCVSQTSGVGVHTEIQAVLQPGDNSVSTERTFTSGAIGQTESSSSAHSSLDAHQFSYRTSSLAKSLSGWAESRDEQPSDLILRTAYEVSVSVGNATPIVLSHTFGHTIVQPSVASLSAPAAPRPSLLAPHMTLCPFTLLSTSQKEILDAFWAEHDISVTLHGDAHADRATNALRYNSFVLLCSAKGCGAQRGLSRGGLSAGGNQVQVNMQTYLFHGIFFAFTEPSMALNLIRHLYGMLPEARNAARSMAIPHGALYPHKTITGANCSAFSLSNCARFQINADLAHIVTVYLTVASGTIPLVDEMMCMELLLETARMWLCVGMWHESQTLFRIDDVNGPDEYSGLTENHFYTHVAAMKHMREAVKTFKTFEKSYSLGAAALLQHIEMSREELSEMQRAADAIVLHRDDRTGVYFAHAQFDELAEWRDEASRHPLSQNYHPAVIYRHKVVQIAEVLLAMLTHPELFERSDLKRNLAYYEPLCTHDHPLSLAVLSGAKFSAFGDFGNGSEEFLALAQLNLDNNKVSADGIHLSWMSGSWFSLAFGIGGVKIIDSALHFRPCLPVGWEQCVFTIKWRCSTLRVTIRADAVTYELMKGNVLRFSHFDARVRLDRLTEARRRVTIPRIVYQDAGSFDGLIFTIESFFSNTDELNYVSWATVLQRYMEDRARRSLLMGVASTQKIHGLSREEWVSSGLCFQDSDHGSLAGLQNVLAARGLQLPLGTPQDSEMVESQYGLGNAKMEEVRALLKDFCLNPIPEMIDLLEDLSRSGIRIAIASFSTNIRDVLAKCPKCLADFATTMIDGDEASEKKLKGRPTTQLFVHAAKKMHLEPSRCVVVGTSFGSAYDPSEFSQFFRIVDIAVGEGHIDSSDSHVRTLTPGNIPSSTARFEDWLLS